VAELQQPIVKICGVRDAGTARVAIDAGASAIGFMLAESRRQVTPEAAAGILGELPATRPPAVGVVVNLDPGEIAELARCSGIDIMQLSGDEPVSLLDDISLRVWKVFRFPDGTTGDDAARAIDPWVSHVRPPEAVLIDAAVAGRYGGTGHRADWNLATALAKRFPVILAGGLDPENVSEAIAMVAPAGVDVSSGVESGGVKDHRLIERFTTRSLGAFAARENATRR
jgi:phosphoribosylanthranilate isomerase